MRLADPEARARLELHDHGILCTVHAERGVDAVPVAYAVDDDGYVGVPVDLVKPKASLRLQRERNLEADPRATLLVEHWDQCGGPGEPPAAERGPGGEPPVGGQALAHQPAVPSIAEGGGYCRLADSENSR